MILWKFYFWPPVYHFWAINTASSLYASPSKPNIKMYIRKEVVTCPKNAEPYQPKIWEPIRPKYGVLIFNIGDICGGNPWQVKALPFFSIIKHKLFDIDTLSHCWIWYLCTKQYFFHITLRTAVFFRYLLLEQPVHQHRAKFNSFPPGQKKLLHCV